MPTLVHSVVEDWWPSYEHADTHSDIQTHRVYYIIKLTLIERSLFQLSILWLGE